MAEIFSFNSFGIKISAKNIKTSNEFRIFYVVRGMNFCPAASDECVQFRGIDGL